MNAVRINIYVVISSDLSQPKHLRRTAFTRHHSNKKWEGFLLKRTNFLSNTVKSTEFS